MWSRAQDNNFSKIKSEKKNNKDSLKLQLTDSLLPNGRPFPVVSTSDGNGDT